MTTTDTADIFGQPNEHSAGMNALIVAAAGRGVNYGTLAATGGQAASTDASTRLEQLTHAHAAALAAGDADLAGAYDVQIDRLVDAARDSGPEAPRNPDGTFATFDGGVMGHKPKPSPGGVREPKTMNGAILAATGRAF